MLEELSSGFMEWSILVALVIWLYWSMRSREKQLLEATLQKKTANDHVMQGFREAVETSKREDAGHEQELLDRRAAFTSFEARLRRHVVLLQKIFENEQIPFTMEERSRGWVKARAFLHQLNGLLCFGGCASERDFERMELLEREIEGAFLALAAKYGEQFRRP